MAVESRICLSNGLPRLMVNGKSVATMAYITYFTERNHYQDFADAGYKLFSLPVYFGGRGTNPVSHVSPISKGIFDTKGKADFGILDREVRRVLEAAPNAIIFPRVDMMMPEWWCEENPLECNDMGCDGDPARECFASLKWREDAGNMLRQFIAHIEASDYCDHIVGYHISDGSTEEWFPFDQKGGVGPASREGFKQRFGRNGTREQWLRYLSETVAEAIACFAAIAKECTQRRLVVGCFYGYTLEVVEWERGHHAAEMLLDCPDVDFFCSPSSYIGGRPAGRDWPAMTAVDSIILHGKMSFVEYDTRTHLSRPLREARPDGCVPGTYEGGVWEGPKDPQVTRWLLKNNAARQLTHGNASWWFDMWGGWYAEEDMMSDLAMYRKYVEESLDDPRVEESQVAVLADEEGYSLLPQDRGGAGSCCYMSREPLGLSGVPYAHYQMGDFDAIRDRYKAFIFLAPVCTRRMEAAMAYCRENRIPYYKVDPETTPLRTDALREFYHRSNVHIWCETDDVVYAGNGWLSIHAASAGEKKLYLPEGGCTDGCTESWTLEEVEGAGTKIGTGVVKDNVLYLDMQQFETRLFRMKRI